MTNDAMWNHEKYSREAGAGVSASAGVMDAESVLLEDAFAVDLVELPAALLRLAMIVESLGQSDAMKGVEQTPFNPAACP